MRHLTGTASIPVVKPHQPVTVPGFAVHNIAMLAVDRLYERIAT